MYNSGRFPKRLGKKKKEARTNRKKLMEIMGMARQDQ